ncbi:MAG: type II toxin-antitoxin system HicB family antitoxin [Chloroflexia bacterium]
MAMVQTEKALINQRTAPSYSMVLEWDPEDRIFVVSVPELPGLHTHGATYAEAAQRGADRIAEWVAILADSGETLPPCANGNHSSLRLPSPLTRIGRIVRLALPAPL